MILWVLHNSQDLRFKYGPDDAKIIRDWLRASLDNALMYAEIRGILGNKYTEVMKRELGIRNPGISTDP